MTALDFKTEQEPHWLLASLLLNELHMGLAFKDVEYEVFENREGRNWAQRNLEIPSMISMLGLERGLTILEVGCGRGVGLGELYKRLAPTKLTGLDNNASLIREAEVTLQFLGTNVSLIHGDVRDMPINSNSFDMVIDFGTLYHIARHEEGLAEIERILKPNGSFVYETPLSQVLSHPIRSKRKMLSWKTFPSLRFDRFGWLWSVRRKIV